MCLHLRMGCSVLIWYCAGFILASEEESEDESDDDSDWSESDEESESDGGGYDLDVCPPGCDQVTHVNHFMSRVPFELIYDIWMYDIFEIHLILMKNIFIILCIKWILTEFLPFQLIITLNEIILL